MTDRKVPTLIPVSSAEAEKYRKNRIINNPITLGTIVSGTGLFMVGSVWFGISIKIWSVICLLLTSVGLGNLFLDIFLRKNKHEFDYLKQHERLREQNIKDLSDYLISEFKEFNLDTPAEQVEKINDFFSNFKTVLGEKFFENSISHGEYLSIAEQINLAVLNKLMEALSKYRSVQTIDVDSLNRSIHSSDNDSEKLQFLNQINLKETQENEVEVLINEVEKTLTGLAELTVKVANISDTSKAIALENLRVQASDLANKSNLYLPEKGA